MSILDRFTKKKAAIPNNASFRLTQEGRAKLQEFGGDPRSRILMALETSGTCDLDEIAQGSGLSKGQVERILPPMVRSGYIQYVSAASGMDGE